jgi:hypothetical protein
MTIDETILGGAQRGRVRPRGIIAWNPHPKTHLLLDQVIAILDEYADYLPLTLRQIFYRLVGVYKYDKDEKAYERLGETLNKARRARIISMVHFCAAFNAALHSRFSGTLCLRQLDHLRLIAFVVARFDAGTSQSE